MSQRLSHPLHRRVAQRYATFFSRWAIQATRLVVCGTTNRKTVSHASPTTLLLLLPLIDSHVSALLSHVPHPLKKVSLVGSRFESDFHRMPAFRRRRYGEANSGNKPKTKQRASGRDQREGTRFCGKHTFYSYGKHVSLKIQCGWTRVCCRRSATASSGVTKKVRRPIAGQTTDPYHGSNARIEGFDTITHVIQTVRERLSTPHRDQPEEGSHD